MNGRGSVFKTLTWFMVPLLAAFVAGCGGGAGEGDQSDPAQLTSPGAGIGVGGAGRGPAPIDLRTAGNFVILARTEITNGPTSAIIGNVGLSPATGAAIDLTCAEVTGVIYTVGAAGPPCRVRNASLLSAAVADAVNAFENDGKGRAPDYTGLGGGNIGGHNLGPATYKWSTGVQIPANLTLTGGPNDVWIFLITQDLSVGSGVQIILAGGALPENVYWLTLAADADVDIGMNAQFKGVIMSETSIVMRTGASIVGRVLAATAVNLDQNAITQPSR